jgi:hypothetical protein
VKTLKHVGEKDHKHFDPESQQAIPVEAFDSMCPVCFLIAIGWRASEARRDGDGALGVLLIEAGSRLANMMEATKLLARASAGVVLTAMDEDEVAQAIGKAVKALGDALDEEKGPLN